MSPTCFGTRPTMPAEFVEAFVEGFVDNGGSLPPDWRRIIPYSRRSKPRRVRGSRSQQALLPASKRPDPRGRSPRRDLSACAVRCRPIRPVARRRPGCGLTARYLPPPLISRISGDTRTYKGQTFMPPGDVGSRIMRAWTRRGDIHDARRCRRSPNAGEATCSV